MASFEKRGNKFRAVVSYKDANGLRKKESKTFTLKKDAVKWATETEAKVNLGYVPSDGKTTYPEYYRSWVNIFKDGKIRPASIKKYASWCNIVDNLFENVKLKDLSTPMIQLKLDEFGKTHSPNYMKNFTFSVKESLSDAHIDGLIDKDIYSRLVANGNPDKAKRTRKFLHQEEFTRLQAYLYDHTQDMPDNQFLMMTLTAVETGARVGEIQALRRSDFDFKNNTVSITRSYSFGVRMVTETKTKSSIRTITISNRFSNTVQAYLNIMKTEELIPHLYTSTSRSNQLRRILKDAGVVQITFHGLRHSHNTFLKDHNVDAEYRKQRLGHSDVRTTEQVYSHLTKEKELTQNELTLHVLGD